MSSPPDRSRNRPWVILLLLGAGGVGAVAALRPTIITAALGSPQAIIVNAVIGSAFLAVALILHRMRASMTLWALLLGVPLLAMLVWTVLPAFRTVRVDEALPGAPAAAATPAADGAPASPASTVPEDLAQGTFSGLDGHDAQGLARLVSVDGTTVLRLEDFTVTNGPDLRVILTGGPEQPAKGGTDLGALKGNAGNQNYELPADLDVSTIGAVVIWCRAFDVDFGVAPLQ